MAIVNVRGSTQVNDTATPLWTRRFKVRVSQLATTSETFIKMFGMNVSGDENIDREMSNQLITTYLPIATMVEYHRDGIPVYVCNHADMKIIYDLIDTHLHAWKSTMTNSLNSSDAPIKDLVDMDAFANSVYGTTKYTTNEGEGCSPFMRYVNSLNTHRSLNAPTPVVAEEDLPTRHSFADVFKDSLNGHSRWS